jgi:hypothetical protein
MKWQWDRIFTQTFGFYTANIILALFHIHYASSGDKQWLVSGRSSMRVMSIIVPIKSRKSDVKTARTKIIVCLLILGRPRRRWEDGIKMDLREIGWGVWSGFTWLRIGIVGGLL